MMRLILAACFLATPALAQENCGATEMIAAVLQEQYGERVQSMGLERTGLLVSFWVNEKSGTWTITTTTADGLTCVVAVGDYFESFAKPSGVLG